MPRDETMRKIDDLLSAAARLNGLYPEAVLVGGTAAAVHAGHRLSEDADFTMDDLRGRFEDVLDMIEAQEDWQTAAVKPPVVILGNFHGVQTTLRQLIRKKPLETETIDTPDGPVRVPTLDEMIRVKAWLALARNAYRDYLDLAALCGVAGPDRTSAALSSFDSYYSDVSRKGIVRDVSPLLQLTRQLFEPTPYDIEQRTGIEHYKSVSPDWSDPGRVLSACEKIGMDIAEAQFSDALSLEEDLSRISRSPTREKASVPDYPRDTHEPHVSADGTVVVIREKGGEDASNPKVDNPFGPAVVTPEGVRYALKGKILTETEWTEAMAREPSPSR